MTERTEAPWAKHAALSLLQTFSRFRLAGQLVKGSSEGRQNAVWRLGVACAVAEGGLALQVVPKPDEEDPQKVEVDIVLKARSGSPALLHPCAVMQCCACRANAIRAPPAAGKLRAALTGRGRALVSQERPLKTAEVELEWGIAPGEGGRPDLVSLKPGGSVFFEHRNLDGEARQLYGSVSTANFLAPQDGATPRRRSAPRSASPRRSCGPNQALVCGQNPAVPCATARSPALRQQPCAARPVQSFAALRSPVPPCAP